MDEKFKISPHGVQPGKTMVEYWRDGEFYAGIYPHQDGIRIVSKHMTGAHGEQTIPPSVIIQLAPGQRKGGGLEPKDRKQLAQEKPIRVRYDGVEPSTDGRIALVYIPDQRQVLKPGKRYRFEVEF